MTTDTLRSMEKENQILPQNRLLNWLRNLFYLITFYLVYQEIIKPYLQQYELFINYTPMFFISIFTTFIWFYLFDKYHLFVNSFSLDLTSLPVIPDIKPSKEEINIFSYFYQGKPLVITYNDNPIPHDHLKLSAGLDMTNFFNRIKKLQIENVQLQQYKDLVISSTIELLDDIKNETNLYNIKKEVINYYEGLTTKEIEDFEPIQSEVTPSELG